MGQSPTRSRLAVEKSHIFDLGYLGILGRNINMFWVQLVVKNDAKQQWRSASWLQMAPTWSGFWKIDIEIDNLVSKKRAHDLYYRIFWLIYLYNCANIYFDQISILTSSLVESIRFGISGMTVHIPVIPKPHPQQASWTCWSLHKQPHEIHPCPRRNRSEWDSDDTSAPSHKVPRKRDVVFSVYYSALQWRQYGWNWKWEVKCIAEILHGLPQNGDEKITESNWSKWFPLQAFVNIGHRK